MNQASTKQSQIRISYQTHNQQNTSIRPNDNAKAQIIWKKKKQDNMSLAKSTIPTEIFHSKNHPEELNDTD